MTEAHGGFLDAMITQCNVTHHVFHVNQHSLDLTLCAAPKFTWTSLPCAATRRSTICRWCEVRRFGGALPDLRSLLHAARSSAKQQIKEQIKQQSKQQIKSQSKQGHRSRGTAGPLSNTTIFRPWMIPYVHIQAPSWFNNLSCQQLMNSPVRVK